MIDICNCCDRCRSHHVTCCGSCDGGGYVDGSPSDCAACRYLAASRDSKSEAFRGMLERVLVAEARGVTADPKTLTRWIMERVVEEEGLR